VKRRRSGFPWVNLIVGVLVGFASIGLLAVLLVALWPSGKAEKSKSLEPDPQAKKFTQDRPWIDASKGPVRIGKFGVEVSHWRIGQLIRRAGPMERIESPDEQIIVSFRITNMTTSEVLDFPGLLSVQGISLIDNSGFSYLRFVPSGRFKRFKSDEELENVQIQPRETVTDVITYFRIHSSLQKAGERPPARIPAFLNLEVPGPAFGVEDSLRLQISASLFREE
jgi:hypothetical protein